MAMSPINAQEKIINEVISRYGSKIDLKKTPYAIIEILRKYGRNFPMGNDNPCGGTPPVPAPPPPGPGSIVFLTNEDLMREIKKLSKLVSQLAGNQAQKSK